MPTITIRTDQRVKSILERQAELSGLTLSGYINLMFRDHISDKKRVDFVSDRQKDYYIRETEKVFNNPKTVWHDIDDVMAEIGEKYGLPR